MNETTDFLIKHGAPFLFAMVFIEQLGVPLPALPWLLAVGALSAAGKFNPWTGVAMASLACVIPDGLWFYLGRYRGRQVMRFLCRIALEPDSCVRRTENVFTKYGMKGIVVAKFLPGLSTMAPPLAGMSGVSAGRFIIADGLGALLYTGCFIGVGVIFSNQIQQVEAAIGQIGGSALALVGGLVVAYIGYKYWRRQTVLRELRMARITVDELRQKQTAGEDLIILDLRSLDELQQNPELIQGAMHLGVSEVEHRHGEIPRDRDVILYCSCPNEVTSARVAMVLRRKGIKRVRPLLGGIDAWKDLKYPLQLRAGAATEPSVLKEDKG